MTSPRLKTTVREAVVQGSFILHSSMAFCVSIVTYSRPGRSLMLWADPTARRSTRVDEVRTCRVSGCRRSDDDRQGSKRQPAYNRSCSRRGPEIALASSGRRAGLLRCSTKISSLSWPRQSRREPCIPQALSGVNRPPAPFARLDWAPVLPVPPCGVTPRPGGLWPVFATDTANSAKGERS